MSRGATLCMAASISDWVRRKEGRSDLSNCRDNSRTAAPFDPGQGGLNRGADAGVILGALHGRFAALQPGQGHGRFLVEYVCNIHRLQSPHRARTLSRRWAVNRKEVRLSVGVIYQLSFNIYGSGKCRNKSGKECLQSYSCIARKVQSITPARPD